MHNPESIVSILEQALGSFYRLKNNETQFFCPKCNQPVTKQTIQQIVDRILKFPENKKIMFVNIENATFGFSVCFVMAADVLYFLVRSNGTLSIIFSSPAIFNFSEPATQAVAGRPRKKNENENRGRRKNNRKRAIRHHPKINNLRRHKKTHIQCPSKTSNAEKLKNLERKQ